MTPTVASRSQAGIAARLARRVLPAAFVIAAVITAGFPIVVYIMESAALRSSARANAGELGRRLREVILADPTLWQYQAQKYFKILEDFLEEKDVGPSAIAPTSGRIPSRPIAWSSKPGVTSPSSRSRSWSASGRSAP